MEGSGVEKICTYKKEGIGGIRKSLSYEGAVVSPGSLSRCYARMTA